MAENFQHVTDILLKDQSASLQFWIPDLHYGIRNGRNVYIEEPNPFEGKVANPWSGLDQQYLHGKRWRRKGFDFRGGTLETLALLEKAAQGETPENTVGRQSTCEKNENINGYSTGQGGIDNWLFTDYHIEILLQDEQLLINLRSGDFHVRDYILSSLPIKNVDEGVDIYENNPVSVETLQALYRGVIISKKIRKQTAWKDPDVLLSTIARHSIKQEFITDYHNELTKLEAFNIPNDLKDAFFIALLNQRLYQEQE